MDAAGNIYVADSDNNRVRKFAVGGTITTVAGGAKAGFSGDGGPAVNALLSKPFGVAVDAAGALYISDYYNNRVRQITPLDGKINTIAGGVGFGYTGDGGAATAAEFNYPTGIALNPAGDVYVADLSNDVIRMLAPTAPAISASGVVSAGAFGGFTSVAPGSWVEIYGSNLSPGRRSWTSADFKGMDAPRPWTAPPSPSAVRAPLSITSAADR